MRLGLSRGPGGPEGAGAPMRGARGAPCRLLPLLLLLSQRTSVQGDAFPPTDPYAHSQLGEAAGSSDWGVLTKPAQDSYGSLRVTRKDPDGGSLLKKCCRRGCEEKELEIFCKDGFGGLDLFRVMGGGPGQGLGIWEDEDQC
ncbi:PREDICTED: relaxin-3 isoform X3 [Myotis brandtii]|uniref:relaxin-3 isoform X3 n=1 Tax=Myotis brandtii TaxID=109478 RepID=UPI0007041B8E|nr:PREDICTED: relaxin-3 isoform X3 [Myotis brandtii]